MSKRQRVLIAVLALAMTVMTGWSVVEMSSFQDEAGMLLAAPRCSDFTCIEGVQETCPNGCVCLDIECVRGF